MLAQPMGENRFLKTLESRSETFRSESDHLTDYTVLIIHDFY